MLKDLRLALKMQFFSSLMTDVWFLSEWAISLAVDLTLSVYTRGEEVDSGPDLGSLYSMLSN